jgi:hypothetical protein
LPFWSLLTAVLSTFAEPIVPEVIVCDRHVDADAWRRFVGREAIALKVSNWVDPAILEGICKEMESHSRFGDYKNVPNLKKFGHNTFENIGNPEQEAAYFVDAVPAIRDTRDVFSGYLTGIDKLRLELDELHMLGCTVQRLKGKTMFTGQARVFANGGGAVPHQDYLPAVRFRSLLFSGPSILFYC